MNPKDLPSHRIVKSIRSLLDERKKIITWQWQIGRALPHAEREKVRRPLANTASALHIIERDCKEIRQELDRLERAMRVHGKDEGDWIKAAEKEAEVAEIEAEESEWS